jgi:hypothetical protein
VLREEGDSSMLFEMMEEKMLRSEWWRWRKMGSESGGGAKEEKSKSPSEHVPGNTEARINLPTENSERNPTSDYIFQIQILEEHILVLHICSSVDMSLK